MGIVMVIVGVIFSILVYNVVIEQEDEVEKQKQERLEREKKKGKE